MQHQPPQGAGYLSKNRNLNLIVAIVGVAWAVMEWLEENYIWFGSAIFLVLLSVFNFLNTDADETKKPH